VADPGFAKGGGNMASMWSASLNGSLGAELPVGSRGRAPGGRSGGGGGEFLKMKAFCTFLYKKVAKS